jgi:hypothetical protein
VTVITDLKSFSRDFDRWAIKSKPFQDQAIPKTDEYGALMGLMISALSLNMQRLKCEG